MNPTLLKALYVILISLGLALIFNFLFFDKLFGISVLIFAVILLGAVFLFGLHQQISLRKAWWLILLIVFFALIPGIRANEFLNFLNLCAILGLLMLLTHELTGTPVFLMKLRDYLILMVLVPLRMLRGALSTVSLIGQVHSSVKHHDVWLRIIKGVIMAVPILIIFGALFLQADLAFSQFINSFVHITISERSLQYLVLLSFAFVGALSFLSYIFFPKQTQPAMSDKQSDAAVQPGKEVEVLVFLGLISALFLVFIGFQVTYLFGGEANIVNAGFTYAEYARRGFWELLAVAMLSLLVLLASEKYAGVESKKDKRFLVPALILIVEVAIVIFSAFKRLSLYIDAYGMTALRFYVVGFIMLLLALFVLLAVKFIKSKREQFFVFGTLLSVAAFLVAVNIVNPDAFIARANMEQYGRTGKIDVLYVGTLSADAEPWKMELYNKLEGEDKEVLRGLLQGQKDNLQKNSTDWQSTNFSRIRALKLLNEPDPKDSSAELTTLEMDISDWSTYRNEELGFEFRFPERVNKDIEFHVYSNESTQNARDTIFGVAVTPTGLGYQDHMLIIGVIEKNSKKLEDFMPTGVLRVQIPERSFRVYGKDVIGFESRHNYGYVDYVDQQLLIPGEQYDYYLTSGFEDHFQLYDVINVIISSFHAF